MATIKKDYSSAGIPGNYNRSNPIPLDSSELYYSYAEAEAYAKNDPTAYVGQTLKVIENDKVSVYVISNTAGTLVRLAEMEHTHDSYTTKEELNKLGISGTSEGDQDSGSFIIADQNKYKAFEVDSTGNTFTGSLFANSVVVNGKDITEACTKAEVNDMLKDVLSFMSVVEIITKE